MGFTKLTSPMRIVKDRLHRIVLDLPQFGAGKPTLLAAFAGDGNDAYVNAVIKRERKLAAIPMGPVRMTVARELDAEIYARTVFRGWEDVFEDDGENGVKAAPWSVKKCEEFLRALAADAPDQFDRIYQASVRDNFRDPLPDPESLGEA